MPDHIAAYVARVVAEAPPLTDRQRDLITGLLTVNATHERQRAA